MFQNTNDKDMNLKNLKGKRALVTGGTKGIGKAIADELAEAGATVIISARTTPEETPHHFIAAELTNADQVAGLAKQIAETFGGIDILINVGGLTTPGGGHSTLTDAHWLQELDLNLISAGLNSKNKHAAAHIKALPSK